MRYWLFILILPAFPLTIFSQISGKYAFSFLNLPTSARAEALGGRLLSINDNDINMAVQNPALINEHVHQKLTLNFVNFVADINHGNVAYGRTLEKYGNFIVGVQYLNYGKFKQANASGIVTGNFSANDISTYLAWGRPLDSLFSIGASLKIINSFYENFYSMGLATDVAANYHSTDNLFSTSLLFKNIGSQIVPYETQFYKLPFDIQLAASYRLPHAPFRLMTTIHHLHKWDLSYEEDNPEKEIDPFTGKPIEPNITFGDKLFRHFNLGVELLPTKSFSLYFSYDYQRRKEMQTNAPKGLTGFAIGFGIYTKKINLSYARNQYNLAGSNHHFSICFPIY